MQLRLARSLAPRSMAADEGISALIGAFVEEETAERAEAQATAEAEAAAVTAPPPAAAAAGETAAEDVPAEVTDSRGKKPKKKKGGKPRHPVKATVAAVDDLLTAATQAQSLPPLVATMAETVTPPLQAAPHRRRRTRRTPKSPRSSPKSRANRHPTADRGGTTAMRRLRRRTSASWPRRRARRRKPPRRAAALRVLTHWQMQLTAPEVPAPEGKVAKMILVGVAR